MPLSMASDPEIDVVVELIGGADGVSETNWSKPHCKMEKSVVTANKALIAHHGIALAKIAEKTIMPCSPSPQTAVLMLRGIPIIKALRDGLAANQFKRIIGILNGTCNYILTSMWETKRSFDEVLKEAQEKGYAEAEPSFDVDGIDTAHKLAILTSLAYGCAPAIDKVYTEGIRRISLREMQFAARAWLYDQITRHRVADRARYRAARASLHGGDRLVARHGARRPYNAILAEGRFGGYGVFRGARGGRGADGIVVADIMDIARGVTYKPFTLPVAALANLAVFRHGNACAAPITLRLSVIDKPGVLAEVTGIFKNGRYFAAIASCSIRTNRMKRCNWC